NTDGTPFLNTVDEGLNYGEEYDFISVEQQSPVSPLVMFMVIVAQSTLHVLDGQTTAGNIKSSVNGVPQPLSYYIHPFDPAFGESPDVLVDGEVHELPYIQSILNAIYILESSVNNIASIYITEHTGFDFEMAGNVFEGTLIPNEGFLQQLEVV